MNWNDHSKLKGTHALLSPSNYHWINYSIEQFKSFFVNNKAKEKGTFLHSLAEMCIKAKQKLPKTSLTLNMYVNDAIGYNMEPEKVLYYSDICYGTADAISFRNNLLRIHDLKTGTTKPSVHQLEVYAALYCLEYKVDPQTIRMELRIYYQNEIIVHEPNPNDIQKIMDKIVEASKLYFDMERENNIWAI